jgi:hypothetical protein
MLYIEPFKYTYALGSDGSGFTSRLTTPLAVRCRRKAQCVPPNLTLEKLFFFLCDAIPGLFRLLQ